MADIYLDNTTGDIIIQNNDLYFTSDVDYVETMKQKIKANLKTFLGEWFLDNPQNPTVGLPYFQSLLSDKLPTLQLAETIFVNALNAIDGVTGVQSISFDYDRPNRNLSVNFKVNIQANGAVIEDVVSLGQLIA